MMFMFLVRCLIFFQLAQVIFASEKQKECFRLTKREDWGAKPPKHEPTKLSEIPPTYVVIHHSETQTCANNLYGIRPCKILLRSIQDYHMNTNGWDDIGYNFLIGGDGTIYEGRGWGIQGAHHPRFNSKSIGICLIGSFHKLEPPMSQMWGMEKLISCGVANKTIAADYHLIGHRQGRTTTCPGDALFDDLKRTPHFDASIPWDN